MIEQIKNYIIFTCPKCLFSIKDENVIKSHIKKCNGTMMFEPEHIKEAIEKEEKLKTQIRLERFKNKLYCNLIQNNTNIKISNILTEEDDEIHVWTKAGLTQIYIHEISNSEGFISKEISKPEFSTINQVVTTKNNFTKRSRTRDQPIEATDTVEDPSKSKKQSYRSVKTCLNLVQEISNHEKLNKIAFVESKKEKMLDQFTDLKNAEKMFEEFFTTLKKNRVYTKTLQDLTRLRMNVFPRMSLASYQNLINEHIRKIEDIFKEKDYTDKKSISIISKGLSPLESRLIYYGNYTQLHLEIDEIQKLDIVLDLEIQSPTEYVSYNSINFFNCFYNYGLVLFSIEKTLKRYLFNKYDFWNIIYLPLPKNTQEDPYSFYILDKVVKEKRYWKMDCRLEELSSSIISNVLPYMISMFKKLYRDVFGDNDFRSDFTQKCQLTECDCEQLIQNIIVVSQPKEFHNFVRTIVKDKATYMPTENDKFNLYGDDSLQRKRFHEKEDIDLVDIIKQLFDDITSEQAVDFYRIRTNLK
jgi:hypothetical protein